MPAKQFYLFGTPTEHSPSPAMHKAGFGANGVAYVYGKLETDDVQVMDNNNNINNNNNHNQNNHHHNHNNHNNNNEHNNNSSSTDGLACRC